MVVGTKEGGEMKVACERCGKPGKTGGSAPALTLRGQGKEARFVCLGRCEVFNATAYTRPDGKERVAVAGDRR